MAEPLIVPTGSEAALFTGAILNTLLVGVLIAQVASYLTHYRKTDKKGTLILVVPSLLALVMAAGACHLAFTYTKFVANPSSAMVAVGRARAYQSLAILTISEVWLLRRTHNVTQSNLLTAIGGVFALSAIGATTCAAVMSTLDNDSTLLWVQIASWLNAGLLIYLNTASAIVLHRARAAALSRRVHYVLAALIRVTIVSHVPTVLCMVGLSISILVQSDSGVHIAFAELVPTLSACALLFTLNSRQRIILRGQSIDSATHRPLDQLNPACAERRGSLGVLIDRFKLDLPSWPSPAILSDRRGSTAVGSPAGNYTEKMSPPVFRLDFNMRRQSGASEQTKMDIV